MKKSIGKYQIEVTPAPEKEAPLVFITRDRNESSQILWKEYHALSQDPFSLVSVSGADWDRDLTPWPAGNIFSGRDHFDGKADDYLALIEQEAIPYAMEICPESRGKIIAGYSLAGLFALYAGSVCDCFDGYVCASGSVWYPGYLDYALSHPFLKKPLGVYLSLGNRETKTRNVYMQKTEDIMRTLAEHYRQENTDCVFELNPGNHFQDAEKRLAKGIAWLLGHFVH